jgi:hypothetical protein
MVSNAIIVGRVIRRPEDDYINLHCPKNLDPCVFKKRVMFSIIEYVTVFDIVRSVYHFCNIYI